MFQENGGKAETFKNNKFDKIATIYNIILQ